MKPSIYWVITENCNLKCPHCYIEAGPGKKDTTISEQDFRKAVDHLPKTPVDLCLSGGEIFTIKNTLYNLLEYTQFVNKKRKEKRQGQLEVSLQSNGFWAKNTEKMDQILQEIMSFGVNYLEIASDDKWHRQAGFKKNSLLTKTKEYQWDDKKIEIKYRGTSNNKQNIYPIGRAKNLGINKNKIVVTWEEFCQNSLSKYKLFVNQRGEVTTCCANKFVLEGNLIEEPLTKIVKRAKKNERISILNDGGIELLAVHDGWDMEFAEALIEDRGACGFCFEAYEELKI